MQKAVSEAQGTSQYVCPRHCNSQCCLPGWDTPAFDVQMLWCIRLHLGMAEVKRDQSDWVSSCASIIVAGTSDAHPCA